MEFVGSGVSEVFDRASVLAHPPVRMLMIRLIVQALLIRLTVLDFPIPPVPQVFLILLAYLRHPMVVLL